jgi:O-antigen ligase
MQFLLIGHMFLFLYRPAEVWPALRTIHIDRVYACVTICCWAFYPGRRWLSNPLNKAFALFFVVLLFSWACSEYGETGGEVVERYFKTMVFYVLLITVVRDERGLRVVLIAYLGVIALYAAHSLWEFRGGQHEYRMGTVRMIGINKTFNDPNTFAASLVYSLPIAFAFWSKSPRRLHRNLVVLYTALMLVCILLSGSRRALLGLGCLGMMYALTPKRGLILIPVLLCAALLGWGLLPEQLQNRFTTIVDPSAGPENARESAEFRTLALVEGVRLWGENPLAGFGPGSFAEASGYGLQAHNLYAQVIAELGTLGAVSFLVLLGCFTKNALAVRRYCRRHPLATRDPLYQVSRAIVICVLVLLLMGAGGHSLYRYNWVWLAGFQTITVYCVRNRYAAGEQRPHGERGRFIQARA